MIVTESSWLNMQETSFDFRQIKQAIKRRRKAALATFAGLLLLSVMVAVLLPPVYRSSATVLIEQQEIPEDLVRSTVTSYADQRIQMITQRAMTFANLSEIIRKYDLYADARKRTPLEEVVEQMREDIDQQMISADVVDPRSGRPVSATIAFRIAYSNENPQLAQKVANEIVSKFLEENLRNRNEMAEQAETFLADELAKLRGRISELEERIARFKQENMGSLPEQLAANRTSLDRKESEIDEISRRIQSLEERRVYLTSQLSVVDPFTSVVGNGQNSGMRTEGRIRMLQDRYLSLSSMYTQDHPDVVRVRMELDELMKGSSVALDRRFVEKQLQILEADYQKMATTYSPDHPDMVRTLRQLNEYRIFARDLPTQPRRSVNEDADNPAYIQLAATLESTEIEIDSLRKSRIALQQKIEELELALTSAPDIEKSYRNLLRDHENTTRRYQELKGKQLEAQLARSLEVERKSERFTLIEPPMIPERPVKPNRLLLIALGFILAAVMAVAVIWVLESADQTIRSSADIVRLTGQSPLAVIPRIQIRDETDQAARRVRLAAAFAGVAFIVVVSGVHFLMMPIDVLWFVLMRKLG